MDLYRQKKDDYCADELLPLMSKVRVVADSLEQIVDRSRWQKTAKIREKLYGKS